MKSIKKLILASASPRRKEILSSAGYNFEIIPSNYDENISNLKYEKELVENCAYKKAKDVLENLDKDKKDFLIISADTVVVSDEKILGKPKDEKDAFLMLKNLSNKTHFVQTSICILNNEKFALDSDITFVTFKNLSDEEIKNYIKNQKPLDKAGSYGIQDENFDFAIKTEGNFDNVVGFSIKLFEKLLKDFN